MKQLGAFAFTGKSAAQDQNIDMLHAMCRCAVVDITFAETEIRNGGVQPCGHSYQSSKYYVQVRGGRRQPHRSQSCQGCRHEVMHHLLFELVGFDLKALALWRL